MQNMFCGCTSMVNLDISIINNSAITEDTKANMEYAFGNNSETLEGAMTALKYITVGDNFNLFDTSVLPAGKWKNQTTNEKKTNTDLTGTLTAGTYEYVKSVNVGDIVHYSPSGTYTWDAEYATAYASTNSNYTSNTKTLNSGDKTAAFANNFHIEEWKVLSVDESTGEIEIVPSSPTKGEVRLTGAQGYNNAVKLLNDACRQLYSDTSKGITARSINMEDIESALKKANYDIDTFKTNYTNGTVYYGKQYSSAYTSAYSKYPVIYGEEENAIINGTTPANAKLGVSEQTRLIERSEGNYSSYIGSIYNSSTTIRPYLTYYYMDKSTFSSALGTTYSNILLPNGGLTKYWVASRCVYAGSSNCFFGVFYVKSGVLNGYGTFYSSGYAQDSLLGLFPVVSLSSDLLNGTETEGEYQVE